MDLHQKGRVGADGLGIVPEMGAIRRSDLLETGPGARQDLGDAELAADFDQLAPRDDHLSASRQGLESQENGRRVVIHDEGRLGAGQAAEPPLDVNVAGTSLLGDQIQLKIRIGRRDAMEVVQGLCRKEGPTEIGMKDHAGGIDDPIQ